MNKVTNLGDRRASQSGQGKDWCPKDMLESALETLQPGGMHEDAIGAVLILLLPSGEEQSTAYYSAGTPRITALGMLTDTIDTMNHPTG